MPQINETDNSEFIKMRSMKYIRKALILFVACIVLYATLDFIFRELRPVTYYIGRVVFTALVIVLDYFEDKRRNSKKNR